MRQRQAPAQILSPVVEVRRRHVLACGLAAAAVWPSLGRVRAQVFDADPFALGVASGCPLPDGVVLWTRLMFPEPPPPADPFAPIEVIDRPPVDVAWEVAEDEGFTRTVRSGLFRAVQEFGHSVHVAVTGLAPGRWYYYRFRAGNAESPTGRTRTAPASDQMPSGFRFAFASCQQYEQGYYAAYRDMAERDLDLVIHLGDYIYERSWGANLVRSHDSGWPVRLDEYRARHALYRSDPNLQAAHARFPWLMIWDDHEVIDNYHGDDAPDATGGEAFLRQRRAAYQAWYEHMPVPPHTQGDFSHFRIYGRHGFGGLLEVALLDLRQYRSTEGPEEDRLLGAKQQAWLERTVEGSRARWTVIAQPTLLSERDVEPGPDVRYNKDGWDGHQASRRRLLESVQKAKLANPLVIGGDLHSFYAADVKSDFAREDAPTQATEFVTGAISSNSPSEDSIARTLAENPHLKYASREHGYSIMDIGSSRATCEFVAISDRKDPSATARVAQGFAVLDDVPGVNRL